MPVGFLVVYSEPGELVTLDEFQGQRLPIETRLGFMEDRYNNEHVPLRLNHLKSFLTGARFSALDSETPSWNALYDIDDTATFSHDSYTRLRANRSPREGNLVKRLSILDRQTAELVEDSGESLLTTSLASKNPSKALVTHGIGDDEEKAREWFGKVVEDFKKYEGWVRTRLFKCIDNPKTGVSVPPGPEAQRVPKYFAVHEFTIADAASAVSADAVSTATSTVPVSNLRRWALYKAYPGITQGNLDAST